MTTSSSGLYGNFGQSNYSAAKMALVGLMQTLGLEGEKYNIRVNCIAPTAATRMLEGLLPETSLEALAPSAVSPAIAVLVSEEAPNKMIICAGAGSFEAAHITLTQGIHLGTGDEVAHNLVQHLSELSDRTNEIVPTMGAAQGNLELQKAGLSGD